MTVLILTLAMGIMAGALTAYTMHERAMNRHAILSIQAQNAARTVLEYATAQAAAQFQTRPATLLQSYIKSKPFNLYSTRGPGFVSGNNSTIFNTTGNTNNYATTGSFQLWCSQPTQAGNFLVTKSDPRNANDQDLGNQVLTQNVYLLASATAADLNGNSVTDYAMQALQLRYSSLFNYSIFYNVPLELGPGAAMEVYGPVFSNQNAYITAGANLDFYGTFNTAGQFSAQPLGVGAGEAGRPAGQAITFDTPSGTQVGISDPTIKINGTNYALGTWVDSYLNENHAPNPNQSATLPNETFAQAASYLWQGYVQDQTMGVKPENMPGVPVASPQTIIQPPDPTLSPNQADANYNAAESQKLSNLAGLYIVVTPNNNGSTTGASVVAFWGTPGVAQTSILNYLYSNPAAKTKNTAAGRLAWLGTAANLTNVLFTKNGTIANTIPDVVNTQRLMFDPRENQLLNTVDIDVGALKQDVGVGGGGVTATTPQIFIGSNAGSPWDIDGTTGTQGQWNGVVYVDVETDTTAGAGWKSISDIPYTNPIGNASGGLTGTETAVRLEDGMTLPARYAGANSQDYGFSLATNAPVYVVGHYNSDGTLPGGGAPSSTQVMTPDASEVPAMVVGDSVDILSANWWNAPDLVHYPNDPNGYPGADATITTSAGGYGSEPTATNTEIAAAFIAGNVATVTGTYTYSGGVENYMRLVENWGGIDLRYRGSIVGLYASSVATGKWPNTSGSTYQAPTRQWGYDNEFGVNHLYPPGSPMVFSMRRFNYTDLSASDFNSALGNNLYKWTAQ